jgi:uncharacterized repeat protein (TIGR02543 family)
MLAGTGVEVPLTSLSSGSIAKAGANFDFWLSDDLAGTSYSDGEVIPIDSTFIHTLTAQWADILYNYTVTFDKGTGTSGSLASKTGTGSSFSLPAFSSGTMVKPGYHFVNWISDSSTPYANLATIRIAADFVHTLIAQWAPNTSIVTYDPRGGTVDTTTATYTSGNTPLVLLTPTYTGFTFNGWYTQTNGGTRIGGAGDSYSPTDPLTIYAQWTADSTPPPSGGGGGGGSPDPIPAPAATTPTPAPVVTPAPEPIKVKAEKLSLKTQPSKKVKGSFVSLTQLVNSPSPVLDSKSAKILSQGSGLQSVQVSLTEISVTPKLNFTGISQVVVELTNGETTKTVTVDVMVNPNEPMNPTFTPKSPKMTAVSWTPTPSATSYEVKVANSVVCTSQTSSCAVPQLLGPAAHLTVISLGNDQTSSPDVAAIYANKKPITALVVNFASGSSKLSDLAKSQLQEAAKTIVAQGFNHFVISGHTDVKGGVDNKALSASRAKRTYDYLKKYAPALDVKLGAFASTHPAARGTSPAALAANRRAELGVY